MARAKVQKVHQAHYATATDARIVQNREALRKGLLKLLDKKPLEKITVRELAAASGVGYTTFYRHHPGKDELLKEIAADEINKLVQLSVESMGSGDIEAAAITLCNYVAEHRALWVTLLTGGAAGKLREQFVESAREVASGRNPKAEWLPPEAGIAIAVASTIELLAWWLSQKDPVPVEQVAKIYNRVIIGPILDAH